MRKVTHRGSEILRAEFRPHPIREEKLSIRGLPEQKVAEPPFAAGANQEVDSGTGVP